MTRLISSGMARSKERSPASTCAISGRFPFESIEILEVTRAQATVEFTSPKTTTRSGFSSEDALEASHDFCGLNGVRTRTDFKMDIRLGKAKIREERSRHRFVVMLSGVDQNAVGSFPHAESSAVVVVNRKHDRRSLHEVRPGSDHNHDLHSSTFPRDDGLSSRPLPERRSITGRSLTCSTRKRV